jgi:hypothetical protein
MISELFLAAILSTSFSVRSPNDATKPLDYEYMVKSEKTEGSFTYTAKRDWERELGEKYVDDIFKFNKNIYGFYGGMDYIDKTSKNIHYETYNIGLTKHGFRIGASWKDNEPMLEVGFLKNFKKDDFNYNVKLSIKYSDHYSDEGSIISLKSELKKWFGKFNIFALSKYDYYNKNEDFQFKVGVGIQL